MTVYNFECCKECKPPKRSPTCHSTCKEYNDLKDKYKAENEIVNEKRNLYNTLKRHSISVSVKAKKRARKLK